MLLHGTTTAEAKSGYGLNIEDELKQLAVIAAADRVHPIDLIPTFMGAHEVPEEYRSNKEGYIDLLIHEILPAVRHQGLARFFDVFCEEGVFSVEESERLVQAGAAAGLGIKIHADEFAPLGGAELAARIGAVSAEHLISISEAGIRALAASRTAAILLPGVSFFLRQDKRAPARALIDAGAAVALATDFNPGSSMTESIPFILQLGVFTLKMSVEEALNAVTANAALRHTRGKRRGPARDRLEDGPRPVRYPQLSLSGLSDGRPAGRPCRQKGHAGRHGRPVVLSSLALLSIPLSPRPPPKGAAAYLIERECPSMGIGKSDTPVLLTSKRSACYGLFPDLQ